MQTEQFELPAPDVNGEEYVIRILTVLGRRTPHLTAVKISEIWSMVVRYPVLFIDEHGMDLDALLIPLMDPRGVWAEIYNVTEGRSDGVAYITDIVPGFDALGHFTLWHGKARGMQPVIRTGLRWVMEKFNLQRVTTEIPVYQRGTIRFTKSLGFQIEGEKRAAAKRNGKWWNKTILGILREEVDNG